MVQPPLTKADQTSMTFQATQNQRRPEQEVSVGFTQPAMSQRDWLSSHGADAAHEVDEADDQSQEPLVATVSDRSNEE
jgi:hypothetical protein